MTTIDIAGSRSIDSLLDRLRAGTRFGVMFGGQGGDIHTRLEQLLGTYGTEIGAEELWTNALDRLTPASGDVLPWQSIDLSARDWRRTARDRAEASVSMPALTYVQLLELRALAVAGLDVAVERPAVVAGHSQGLLAALVAAGRLDAVDALVLAHLIGAAATRVSRHHGLAAPGDTEAPGVGGVTPMLAVSGLERDGLNRLLEEFSATSDLVVGVTNGVDRHVVVGAPDRLAAFEAWAAARKPAGVPRRTAPRFERVASSVAFHHPALAPAARLVADAASRCGVEFVASPGDTPDAAGSPDGAGAPTVAGWDRVPSVEAVAAAIVSEPLDWTATLAEVLDSGVSWLVDFSPNPIAANLSRAHLSGTGLTVVSPIPHVGVSELITPGAEPQHAADYRRFTPGLRRLPDGSVVADTRLTRLTGQSPFVLAGMTPTTVEAPIVAAAANAGHWAELAGGGQVTEAILAERLRELGELLDDGVSVHFNTLFLDPYLWNLQLGSTGALLNEIRNGAPIRGVTVSAGIPELDDAVALVEQLRGLGVETVTFKPGTIDGISRVIEIADAIAPTPVVAHIEGGLAGGHHSWEDLDQLLLATYAKLRRAENLIVCVGGGIGTPDVAFSYLDGSWAERHGRAAMPIDGILIGTAAMATAEASTSPQVKALLASVRGHAGWIEAGTATNDMASGRSQLGADIHEIDNAASRAGRLLDEVAGDAAAVAERRDEIIEAISHTAKPYFGDVADMTYGALLARFAQLCAIGRHGRYEDGAWLDASWRRRFIALAQRAEARLAPQEHGEIDTLFGDPSSVDDPHAALAALAERFEDLHSTLLHPADASHFVTVCRQAGKPVPFVPVIDAEVRRWWRSDSLWQSHDDRYDADAVVVIPGPAAIAGIDAVDEPVASLLDRFEATVVARLLDAGVAVLDATTRRDGALAGAAALERVLAESQVSWAGRRRPNPVLAIAPADRWTIDESGVARTAASDAVLVASGPDRVRLEVPLSVGGAPFSTAQLEIALRSGRHSGLIVDAASANAWSTALRAAAMGDSSVGSDTRSVTFGLLGALDHAALFNSPVPLPDSLVGLCWPAVFAALDPTRLDAGGADTDSGSTALDGFGDLLHLDHRAEVVDLPDDDTELQLEIRTGPTALTRAGRMVEVDIELRSDGDLLATLHERFVIRDSIGDAPLPGVASFLALDGAVETPRRTLRRTTVSAPPHSAAMEAFTGDHNPLHNNEAVAAVAGLDAPIVHGMWVSAAMQRAAQHAGASPVAIRRWQVRFVAPLAYGADVDLAVRRIGRLDGGDIVEVEATVDGSPIALASAVLAAPLTAYAFPGQGIQRPGMGLDALSRSAAARAIWERADRHTIERLGFSILRVVRDNPTEITVGDQRFRHPDGVLYLTQFTQVAMATLASAQVAELREAGGFVPGAITCGHSVGEYNALAAVTGILALEDVLEVVYHRGLAMHRLVPRDAEGASRYRMAAVRPEEAGLSEDELVGLVADLWDELNCSATDADTEFLQIVNFNLRGRQYAVAGTESALERLRGELETRRERHGGKGVYVLVPGIDVPFHSAVLRGGVDDFRSRLDAILPERIDPDLLVGRYIPNLVPRLFTLDVEFVTEIAETVPSTLLNEVLADWETWSQRPQALCRVLLLELLAWQFASPVRWIETQDLLFTRVAAGGLGVQRFVEVGLASQPTIESLARQSAARGGGAFAVPQILGVETARAVVFAEDVDDPDDSGDEAPTDSRDDRAIATPDAAAEAPPASAAARGSEAAATGVLSSPPVAAVPTPSTTGASGAEIADLAWSAEDGIRFMLSWWTKIRADQLGASDTIEGLVDGASSRRNQLLMDLGKEFNLGVIDGAAEAPLRTLIDEVATRARTYRAPGPVLRVTIDEQLRRICGPAKARPSAVAARLEAHWGLGAGWGHVVSAALASGTRSGSSVRGGELSSLTPAGPSSAAELDQLIDAAVTAVATARGIAVAPRSAAGDSSTLDAAAAAELLDGIWGPDGVLTRAGRILVGRHDGDDPAGDADADEVETLRSLAATVERELGGGWASAVAPAFDPRRTLVLDDRWAGEREDLFRLANTAPSDLTERERLTQRLLSGVSERAVGHARYFARFAGEPDLLQRFGRIVEASAQLDAPLAGQVALVTGASPSSIAAAVVSELLAGGATVIATSSRLDTQRVEFFRSLYHRSATGDAALWLAPANLASFDDVDRLFEWITTESSVHEPGAPKLDKPALSPTLVLPFAAPSVSGDLTATGPERELEMRVLLWSVERLIAKAAEHAERDLATVRVVLPGSPNRGMFGGDGAYGEAKAAFDALVERSRHERWGERVELAHAIIGWVRGTGLMAHNDAIADEVERQGIRTWTPSGIARELVSLALAEPLTSHTVDLSGGLWGADIDLRAIGQRTSDSDPRTETDSDTGADADTGTDVAAPGSRSASPSATIAALPTPPKLTGVDRDPAWPAVDAAPEDTVVIVGFGEVGPLGSARTRFDVEVTGELSPAAVAELAWLCGLIRWENDPEPGFYDSSSGEAVAEADLVERYHDVLLEHSGIRFLDDDGSMVDGTVPLLCSVFLDEDLSFTVGDEAEAAAFVRADPERTVARPNGDGTVTVTRKAGTEIRVPRRIELPRHVGAQLPRGFDPTAYGIPADMVDAIDRVAIWNLVATVDAFVEGGIEPSELLRWVHPTEVANTQGTGIGGIGAIRAMYVDSLLGEDRPNDILQEGLPNVVAAHVMQSYVGGYGAMVHPVAACATAAVSIEEAYDKIRTGRASVVVAGGFDDYGHEGLIGFANMAATASSDAMIAAGIDPKRMSRANDRRRAGFVEGQGGGTIVVARGDVALELGLPVRGVIAWAGSFSDGVNTSIPAPGLGLIGAGRGGSASALARSLAGFGIDGGDIAVVSKHDTSTAANDPNESTVHERLATALGRDPEHPLPVISQKSVTGHAKGGAAAFQINGLCQVLESGVIPPNRSLDCVDPDLARFERLVWPTSPVRSSSALRAGLVTSLGFGHVSAIVAVVHPDAFLATVPPERRREYLERAGRRRLDGQRRRIAARTGGPELYRRPESPYGEGATRQAAESAMLVSDTIGARP